jgi:hypothetical protein
VCCEFLSLFIRRRLVAVKKDVQSPLSGSLLLAKKLEHLYWAMVRPTGSMTAIGRAYSQECWHAGKAQSISSLESKMRHEASLAIPSASVDKNPVVGA